MPYGLLFLNECFLPTDNLLYHPLSAKHRATLEGALNAIRPRGYWTAYSEMPSPKVYGATAPDDGKRAFEAHLGTQFELAQPGQVSWMGGEQSPFGVELNVRYPVCEVETLVDAGQKACAGWRSAGRVVCRSRGDPAARHLGGAPAERKAALLGRSGDDLGGLLFGQVPLVDSDDDS